jgi:uronate dehydrogenase
MIDPMTDRVLITGAAGAIGTALRDGLRAQWRHLRLTDIRPVQNLTNNEEAIVADVADRKAIDGMMHGVRAVVHLAGMIGNYDLEALFRVNARGLFDVFESARLGGVERIVFASSNHAFGCYPITEPVSPALPPRPDSLYGVFKVLGETMLRNYYDRHGIQSVSLRIGTYRTKPIDQRSLATWLSPADVAQLVDLSLRHADPGCMVVNGYSNNTRLKTHDPNWAVLGYQPRDNAEDYREALRAQGVDVDGPDREEWEWPEHGGAFARMPERPAFPADRSTG